MGAVKNKRVGLGIYNFNDIDSPKSYDEMTSRKLYMDRSEADRSWKTLRSLIRKILTAPNTKVNFEELYRHGYYLVQHKYGEELYTCLRDLISEHIISTVELAVVANLNDKFLEILNLEWERYLESVRVTCDLLMYLDRTYLANSGAASIYTMGVSLFRLLVVESDENVEKYLKETLLALILKERRGGQMDRPTFRKTTKLLMDLGSDTKSIYQSLFENPLIQESSRFFQKESQRVLENNSVFIYLKYVENRLQDELARSEHCFNKTTTPLVLSVVEDKLIKSHMKTMVEMSTGVMYMLENKLANELASMYGLLSRVEGGLKIMFNCISQYVHTQAMLITMNSDTSNNAVLYVQQLLNLKDEIEYYLMNSFAKDTMCSEIILKNFVYVLNLDKARTSEYISLFIDDKLKKNVKGMNANDKVILLDKPQHSGTQQ